MKRFIAGAVNYRKEKGDGSYETLEKIRIMYCLRLLCGYADRMRERQGQRYGKRDECGNDRKKDR